MAGNDRKSEHGTEAAAHFLALKRQQPEREQSVDVKSWEPRAVRTLLKVGTLSNGKVREHGTRAEVRGTYLALGLSEREKVTVSKLFTFYGQKAWVGVVVDNEHLEKEVGSWKLGNMIQNHHSKIPGFCGHSTALS